MKVFLIKAILQLTLTVLILISQNCHAKQNNESHDMPSKIIHNCQIIDSYVSGSDKNVLLECAMPLGNDKKQQSTTLDNFKFFQKKIDEQLNNSKGIIDQYKSSADIGVVLSWIMAILSALIAIITLASGVIVYLYNKLLPKLNKSLKQLEDAKISFQEFSGLQLQLWDILHYIISEYGVVLGTSATSRGAHIVSILHRLTASDESLVQSSCSDLISGITGLERASAKVRKYVECLLRKNLIESRACRKHIELLQDELLKIQIYSQKRT